MRRVIVMILGVALLAAALAGCGWSIDIGGLRVAGPGELYDVNDHGELDLSGVESIRITSVSDTVTVAAGGEKVSADLVGQCRSTGKPVYLDMSREGDTVNIEVKYPAVSMSNSTSLNVLIPEGYKGDLSVHTVSGGIQAESLPYDLQKVDLGTISGSVRFGTKSFASLDAGTTSGGISVSGIAAAVTAKSISGSIDLEFDAMAAVSAGTVSGDVDVRVPADAFFDVEFGTVSGSFHSSGTGLDVSNARDFKGSAGSGGPLMKVHTTSGSFTLQGK